LRIASLVCLRKSFAALCYWLVIDGLSAGHGGFLDSQICQLIKVIIVSTNHELKLANLQPYQRGVNILFKVLKTEAIRNVQSRHDGSKHRVADVLIGDDTGVMRLTLWDDEISLIEDGKVFRIVGGQSGLFQGQLQVSLGRSGKLEPSEQTISEIKRKNNLSSKSRSASSRSKRNKESDSRPNRPKRRSRGFLWTRVERKS
jgi:replication factor A1